MKPLDALRHAISHYAVRAGYGLGEAEEIYQGLLDLKELYLDRADCLDRLREAGRLIGCDHAEDPDGRQNLVGCLERALNPGDAP